jgi:hypothetical protein
VAAGICPRGRAHGRLPSRLLAATAVTTHSFIWILVAAGIVTLLAVLIRRRGPDRRARAMRELLDAADALESRLRVARAEIEAVAGEQGTDPVGDAMREMLRQRLWLRDYGRAASLAQLAEVRASIDDARSRIEAQLAQIERARAPLA